MRTARKVFVGRKVKDLSGLGKEERVIWKMGNSGIMPSVRFLGERGLRERGFTRG